MLLALRSAAATSNFGGGGPGWNIFDLCLVLVSFVDLASAFFSRASWMRKILGAYCLWGIGVNNIRTP